MNWLRKINGGRVPGPQESDYRAQVVLLSGLLFVASIRLTEGLPVIVNTLVSSWPFSGR